MRIEDSVIVITGATAGIGQAIAKNLAQHQGKLVLTGRRQNRLDALQNELNLPKSHVLLLAGDIQKRSFCDRLINQTIAHFGRIDVLINNAGIGHNSELIEIPDEDFKQAWETNVYSLAWLSQTSAKAMKNQEPEPHTGRRGQIINVSSIVGDRPLIRQAVYTASKAAVNAYSRGLRMELASSNITVSILYPGLTATEFHSAKLGVKGPTNFRKPGVKPAEVAKIVERAILKQRLELYVTYYDWFFVQANRHFPRITDYIFRYVANGKKR